MPYDTDHLQLPVMNVARRDFTKLLPEFTVQEALDYIRREGVGEKIVYFYVVDEGGRLKGVLPTRRLLAAPLHQRISELMIPKVVAVPQTATVMDACDFFILHKFLALPVVDEKRRMVGVVDVGVLTNEVFDVAEREQWDEVFETIGFRLSQVRDASPLRAFRFRFPWLMATIGSGTICAILASAYEMTLAKSLVLAFFLTLALGLGESVSIQAMTITIQALRSAQPTVRWYLRTLRREAATAILLGAGCGTIVGLIVWLWRGEAMAAISIGASILLALVASCGFGLSIPTVLHACKLDPKIAAGPMTLALSDIFTLLFYFSIAAFLL
ncbi:MAG: magnesium transporter [Desulfobacterales bacterium]|jgi:magnesium transporter|nr:magnesium transporter [Desulfobacterales bacterium]